MNLSDNTKTARFAQTLSNYGIKTVEVDNFTLAVQTLEGLKVIRDIKHTQYTGYRIFYKSGGFANVSEIAYQQQELLK